MTRGAWRMLAMVALLALVSFLSAGPVDAQAQAPAQAQGTPCKQIWGTECDTHATCYHQDGPVYVCDCDSPYTGNGFSCKYSAWRFVVYIFVTVIGFVLVFYLCLSCLGYRSNQPPPSDYPMQPMAGPPYGYPPPPQSSANPAMYAYPPQPGYPVTGFPPPQGANTQPPISSKVPGPSGTV